MRVIEAFEMEKTPKPNPRTGEVLAEQLILLRNLKGLSQDQAATAAGIGIRTLRLWEAGGGNPELSSLEQIADAYGVTLAALFEPWRMGEKGADPHVLCKKLEAILKHPLKGPAIKTVINAMYYKV